MSKNNQLYNLLKRNYYISKLSNYKQLIELVKNITKNMNSENNILLDSQPRKINLSSKNYIYVQPIETNIYYFKFVFFKRTQKIDKLLYDFYQLLYIFFVYLNFKKINYEKHLEIIVEFKKSHYSYKDVIKAIKYIFESKKEVEEMKKMNQEGEEE